MLKKFLAAFATLFLAVGLSAIAVAAPASATHPKVSGSYVCNTETGLYDITWKVTGDPSYPNAVGTVKSQTQPTTPTFVGLTVQGTGFQESVQKGVTAGSYEQKIVVNWDGTHDADDKATVTIPKTPACAIKPPECIPTSAVTYTYDPATNSGVVTVPNVASSTGKLCDPFWVTATSWKFTTQSIWPQIIDQVNPVGKIDKPGDYPYAATVACGQGDIYASFTGEPVVGTYLTAPGTPFEDTFLHQMGFTGPNPTYMQNDPACAKVDPKVDYRLGACYPNGSFSSKNLYLIFDNTNSTVPVTFSVPGAIDVTSPVSPQPSITRVVPAGQKIEVETTPVWDQGVSYVVELSGVYGQSLQNLDIVVPAFVGCLEVTPGDPSHTDETCVAGSTTPVGGSITVGLETGLTYTLDGPGTKYDGVITKKTTTGLPAGDYLVSVSANPGYVLTGADKWPYTITVVKADCTIPALAMTGSSPVLGLGVIGALLVLGGVGFAVARRRIAAARAE